MDVLSEHTRAFLDLTTPAHTDVQAEMAAYAADHDFPDIGRDAGGVLRLLARLTDARRVFEFGSGFGYSATWFLRGMDDDGHVVCTEHDAEEVELGREFLATAGLADRVTYHTGDALAAVDEYPNTTFDLVLVDIHKSQYPEAFERIRDRVRVGGAIVADNVLTGPFGPDDVVAALRDRDDGVVSGLTDARDGIDNDSLGGIVEYLGRVGRAADFETTTVSVGEGLAVSVKTTA
jgi:predicted O-methyltransferase YrrM